MVVVAAAVVMVMVAVVAVAARMVVANVCSSKVVHVNTTCISPPHKLQ